MGLHFNAEALVAAHWEIGLEVRADKTKYMVMSRDQNAGRIHTVRIDNSTFERVEEFKYLGKTLTNQNSIAEEFVLLTQYCAGDKIEKNEMGWACGAYG